jgi:sugar phosphate isomerase/epimerase
VGCLEVSFSNGTFSRRELAENIGLVKKLGFRKLEFNMKSVEVEADTSIYAARDLIELSGLTCLTLHSAVLHVGDKVEVHKAVYYGKISLEFARLLKVPIMVVHSNVSRKLSVVDRCMVLEHVFEKLTEFAEELNVKLALENLSFASSGYGKNVSELVEIFGLIDDDVSIGFTLDFCHAEATGQTASLLEKYHDRLCNVHLSNRAHRPFEARNDRLTYLIEALKGFGYMGPLTLELSGKCSMEQILRTRAVVEESLM